MSKSGNAGLRARCVQRQQQGRRHTDATVIARYLRRSGACGPHDPRCPAPLRSPPGERSAEDTAVLREPPDCPDPSRWTADEVPPRRACAETTCAAERVPCPSERGFRGPRPQQAPRRLVVGEPVQRETARRQSGSSCLPGNEQVRPARTPAPLHKHISYRKR